MGSMNGIQQTIKYFGSQSAIARALGLSSYRVVQQWVKSGHVPPKYCPEIERLTDRKIKCEDLNASVDWAFVREYCCVNGKKAKK